MESVKRGIILAAVNIALFIAAAYALTHWPSKPKPYDGDYIKGTFVGTKEEYGTMVLDGNGHSRGYHSGSYYYRAESGTMNVFHDGGLLLTFDVTVAEDGTVTITSTRGGIEGEWSGKMEPREE